MTVLIRPEERSQVITPMGTVRLDRQIDEQRACLVVVNAICRMAIHGDREGAQELE